MQEEKDSNYLVDTLLDSFVCTVPRLLALVPHTLCYDGSHDDDGDGDGHQQRNHPSNPHNATAPTTRRTTDEFSFV